MFKNIEISFDYKNLEMMKNALENEINSLNNQVYLSEDDNEVINEHKLLLSKINSNIKKVQDF